MVVVLSFLIIELNNKKGKEAVVFHEGKQIMEIDLTKNGEYIVIEGFILIVENQKIRVKETNCNDKTCLHMGETNSSGKPIVCAPNGIYIKVIGISEDVIIG